MASGAFADDPKKLLQLISIEDSGGSADIEIAKKIQCLSGLSIDEIKEAYRRLWFIEFEKTVSPPPKVVNLDELVIDPQVIKMVPKERARVYEVVPIKFESDILTVAISGPEHLFIADDLNIILGIEIVCAIASKRQIHLALEKYYPEAEQ